MAYQSVVWTSGDVITESKLDSMINNDQASDSHAAGLVVNNNVAYQAKQAGGTAKDLIKLGTDDILRLSQIRVQNDNSDSISSSTQENILVQTGWTQQVGSGANNMNIEVTFPTAFGTIFSVLVTPAGFKNGSAAADITEFDSFSDTIVMSQDITTSGFNGSVARADNEDPLNASNYYGIAWIAIGSKS